MKTITIEFTEEELKDLSTLLIHLNSKFLMKCIAEPDIEKDNIHSYWAGIIKNIRVKLGYTWCVSNNKIYSLLID